MKSKMISVRLNLKVAAQLEQYCRGSWISKNLVMNRGARLYIQLMQVLPDNKEDLRDTMNNAEFWSIIKKMIEKRNVYWEV